MAHRLFSTDFSHVTYQFELDLKLTLPLGVGFSTAEKNLMFFEITTFVLHEFNVSATCHVFIFGKKSPSLRVYIHAVPIFVSVSMLLRILSQKKMLFLLSKEAGKQLLKYLP